MKEQANSVKEPAKEKAKTRNAREGMMTLREARQGHHQGRREALARQGGGVVLSQTSSYWLAAEAPES